METITKKTVWDLKDELKSLGKGIRALKDDIKETFRRQEVAGHKQYSLRKQKDDFRHKHIAYCLLKGTERAKIETPAEDNQPNESLIKAIVATYA